MIHVSKSKFWHEFIEMYKSFPELWDRSNADFKNKHLKENALLVLAQKLQEHTPYGNVKMVRKKIKHLRRAFTNDLQKKKLSEKNGTVCLWEPLWYYEKLKFLDNKDTCCSPTIDNPIDISDDDEVVVIETSNDTDANNCSRKRQIAEAHRELSPNFPQVQKKPRQTESEAIENQSLPFVKLKEDLSQTIQIENEQVQDQQIQFMEKESYDFNASNGNQPYANIQNEVPNYAETLMQTESAMVGFNVSKKLMKMNEFQQILAENLIYKILLMGVCGELTRATDIHNPP